MLPKSLQKIKVFEGAEWEALSTVERLYVHMISSNEVVLSKKEENYLIKLTEAYGIIAENPVRWIQHKLIAEACGVQIRQARNIRKDAEFLFGDINSTYEEITKESVTIQLQRIANKAEADEDYKSATSALNTIAKINKWEVDKGLTKEDFKKPTIIITSNPEALNTEQIEEAHVEESDS